MLERIAVILIVVAAFVIVGWRIYRMIRGKTGCPFCDTGSCNTKSCGSCGDNNPPNDRP